MSDTRLGGSNYSDHDILKLLAKAQGREEHVCDATCEYWRFPHLECACVLSPVFSVNKGELCAEYQPNGEILAKEPFKTEDRLRAQHRLDCVTNELLSELYETCKHIAPIHRSI